MTLTTKSTVLFCAIALISISASADSISLTPTPADLYDLDHEWCYIWGLRDANAPFIIVQSATLSFDDIRNWDGDPNKLFIHLLDTDGLAHEAGDYNTVSSFRDTQPGLNDQFDGEGIELVTYTDLPEIPQDLGYTFTPDQLDTLNEYLRNGNDFALGFDPDCHFYNCGVQLDLQYGVIPEPGTMALIGMGGLLLLGKLHRKRRTK